MSFEDQIASDVKLDGGDHTGDELQEDQQCEMGLDLLSILSHGVRHGLQDVSVLAGMDGRHQPAFDEIELFYGQCGIQVLLLGLAFDLARLLPLVVLEQPFVQLLFLARGDILS